MLSTTPGKTGHRRTKSQLALKGEYTRSNAGTVTRTLEAFKGYSEYLMRGSASM